MKDVDKNKIREFVDSVISGGVDYDYVMKQLDKLLETIN